MSQTSKNMQYLTVNSEDCLQPLQVGHSHVSRPISPSLSVTSLLDEAGKLGRRKSASSKSLHMLHKFASSDLNLSNSTKALYKSSENLCFGRTKKKLNRQAPVNEVYRPRCNTDPADMMTNERQILPITTSPGSRSATTSKASSLAPTPLLKRRYGNGGGSASSALSSLIEQTLRVTTASVGLEADGEERLTQQTSKSASDENVKRRFSSRPPGLQSTASKPSTMESVDKFELLKCGIWSTAIMLWLYWLWTRRDLYRFALNSPGFIGPPIFGSLSRIRSTKNMINAFGKMFEECRRYTLSFWLGIYPVMLTADPDVIKQVLLSPELLNKAQPLYRPIYETLKGGLIASPASEWQHHRKMINPSFHYKVIVGFLPIFNKGKNQAIAKLDAMVDNGEYKLNEVLQRLTLGITVETTMGKEMKEGDEVSEGLVKAFSFSLEKVAIEVLSAYLKLDRIVSLISLKARTYIYDFIGKLIHQKLDKIAESNLNNDTWNDNEAIDADAIESLELIKKTPNIFIDQAIKIYQKGQFSFDDVVGESNTIVAASSETTSNGVLSALMLLAMHPAVQERLFEEIVNVFPQKKFYMENHHVEHLPYLDMVVQETLRLMPSIPAIGRQVVKDTQLMMGINLPKGLTIFISIFHLHRRPDIWGPDAANFNPDHFLPENLTGKHPYAYVPFSKGIRNCIGWRYALLAIKVMLAAIVRNYTFTTNSMFEELQYVNNISLKFGNEPKFRIYRRNK